MVRPAPAAAPGRAFPPPPAAVRPVEGLIDFPLHSAPDVFGRAFDDEQAGMVYRDNGMEAVVMKSHVVATADRAWLLRKHVPKMKAFGGVGLNAGVGRINPEALQGVGPMQGGFGRVVWFPTF